MNGREARLKEVYAGEYPGITPEVWMPVAELAQKLVERHNQGRRVGRFTRTFDPTHFEFRGGKAEARPRDARTRSTDLQLRQRPERPTDTRGDRAQA